MADLPEPRQGTPEPRRGSTPFRVLGAGLVPCWRAYGGSALSLAPGRLRDPAGVAAGAARPRAHLALRGALERLPRRRRREGRVVINTGMGFEAPVHKRNFDAVDRGPVRYIVLTQGHVDHVGGVDLLPRARHRDRRPGEQRGPAGGRRAHPPLPRAAQRLRLRRGDRPARTPGSASTWAAPCRRSRARCRPLVFEDRHRLRARRRALRAARDARAARRTDSLVVWLPERAHLLHRQRVRRALRPLPEPRHDARRPLPRRAALRRLPRARARARARAAAGRPPRTRSRGASRSSASSRACATPCCTSTTRPCAA